MANLRSHRGRSSGGGGAFQCTQRTAAKVGRILRAASRWAPSESTLLRLFHRLELIGPTAGDTMEGCMDAVKKYPRLTKLISTRGSPSRFGCNGPTMGRSSSGSKQRLAVKAAAE